ncbi:hypothetical protein FRC02_003682 [Tulasnella sp. 418]|nr:hypothetical protein FRC02_003682 [Tulasnella sp. 418]
MKANIIATLLFLASSTVGAPSQSPLHSSNGGDELVAPTLISLNQARQELGALRPRPVRYPYHPGFDRTLFGWPGMDFCQATRVFVKCDMRNYIKLRDGTKVVIEEYEQDGEMRGRVIYGIWTNPYNGKPLDLENISIDHVVPLLEAWISGAHGWEPVRRYQFGNDENNLLAISRNTNILKGSDGPDIFRPFTYTCQYAKIYIHTKHKYSLTIHKLERDALQQILDTKCVYT